MTTVAVAPSDDLVAKIAANPTIDTFVLSGVRRLTTPLTIPRPVTVEAATQGVRITGSRVVTGFAASGSQWVAQLPAGGPTFFDPVTTMYLFTTYCEDIYLDGVTLFKIGVKHNGATYGQPPKAVGPGECFIDYDTSKGYIGTDPGGRLVETNKGGPETLISGGADGVTWQNLIIGEALLHGLQADHPPDSWTVTGCELRNVHGDLARIGSDWKVLGNVIHHAGEKGLAQGGTDSEVGGNEFHHCNFAQYQRSDKLGAAWDAGTFKFTGTSGLNFHDNYIHDSGQAWWDVRCVDTLIERNRFDGFAPNVIACVCEFGTAFSLIDNSFANCPRALSLSSAPDCVVRGNLFEASCVQGIHVIDEPGRPVSSNETIIENAMTMNGTDPAIYLGSTCKGHTIDTNAYHLGGTSKTSHFHLCGSALGFADWKKKSGYDAHSSADYH